MMLKSMWRCHQACSMSNDGCSARSEVMHMHTLKHTHTTPPLLHHIIKPISRLNGEVINTSQGSGWARRVHERLVTLVLMVPTATVAPPNCPEWAAHCPYRCHLHPCLSHSLSPLYVSDDNRPKVNPSWYCRFFLVKCGNQPHSWH